MATLKGDKFKEFSEFKECNDVGDVVIHTKSEFNGLTL